ncbi:hypothetical protein Q4I30_001128 [Leishmania utingensis]|uniref:Uncharacterized protein n=1 Tax=Leishmania utingensis TaxID=653362 RepID=A0AAW3AZL0_9TRYP
MLHEAHPTYDAAPLAGFDTVDAVAGVMLTSIGSAYSPCQSISPVRQQQQHQQRMLHRCLSSSGSYIAAVRCSSTLPVPQGSVGSNPLSPKPAAGAEGSATRPQLPFAQVAAAAAAGWGDHEYSLHQSHQQEKFPLTPAAEDFVHEILAMNTLAMEQCYAAVAAGGGAAAVVGAAIANSAPSTAAASEEPMRILGEAYMRVDETFAQDIPVPLLDELKTTTLNNMGVVECNRGQPRQALSHFEAARQLEENNGMASPSIALNMCAAYNALRMFDKATAAALEAIDMLRSLELQRRRNRRLTAAAAASLDGRGGGAMDSAKDGDTSTMDLLLEAAAAPKIADSQNDALWGAAWNNLAVAQINTARGSKDTSEYTNALSLFQNAMRATQELLGMQHPMSKAVVVTFRSVRRAFRKYGAFKQHRSLLRAPLPPVDPREQEWEEAQGEVMPGHTRHGTLLQQRQQLTITFRGEVTGGQKKVERLDSTPYPGAVAHPYQRQQRMEGTSSGRGTTAAAATGSRRCRSSKGRQPKTQTGTSQLLRNMPLSSTLSLASAVYGNPHPLLYSPPPSGQCRESAPLFFPDSTRMAFNQYDGPVATDSSHQSHDQGQHGHPISKRGPATYKDMSRRSKSGTTGNHLSQTAPSSSRSYVQGSAASAAAASSPPQPTRPPVAKVLPPIGVSASTGAAAVTTAAFAEWGKGHGTAPGVVPFKHATSLVSDTFNSATITPVFMHHPPQRSSQMASSAPYRSTRTSPLAGVHSGPAATAHLHQSKMLLLATPSSTVGPTTTTTTTTTYYPLEVPSGTVASSAGHRELMTTSVTPPPTIADTGDPSAGTHELFRGMWVTADPHYVHRGPRVFGRPAYYTIATTLDVTEDGVSGDGSATGAGTGATALTTWTDSTPCPVLPTLTYSSSGSEEDNSIVGEGGDEYDAPDVQHRTSVSTDAKSSSVSSLTNKLAETSRMTE